MSVINEPINKNFLSPLGFVFNLKKTPATNFFVTRASLPGLNLAFAEVPTPFVKMPVPGEKIQFNDLSVTFKVDEDMRNWNEIFDWMVALGFPKSFDQYREIRQKLLEQGLFETDITFYYKELAKLVTMIITFTILITQFESFYAHMLGSALIGLFWQ